MARYTGRGFTAIMPDPDDTEAGFGLMLGSVDGNVIGMSAEEAVTFLQWANGRAAVNRRAAWKRENA